MGHYIRVLSPNPVRVPMSRLTEALEELGAPVALSGDDNETNWRQMILAHPEGKDIAVVECDLVEPGSLAEEEIGELIEDIADAQPASAAAWLKSYLPKVKAIYAIQVVAGAAEGEGWDIVDAVRQALSTHAGGIIQADNEGFSNEDGYHILWQFADDVEGWWWMAVLKNGRWQQFEMDLGDPDHRAAFLAGKVPAGVEVVD
jgi:hypothetical protein